MRNVIYLAEGDIFSKKAEIAKEKLRNDPKAKVLQAHKYKNRQWLILAAKPLKNEQLETEIDKYLESEAKEQWEDGMFLIYFGFFLLFFLLFSLLILN